MPLLLLLCAGWVAPPDSTEAVVHVNGEVLTRAEFERSYVGFLLSSGRNDTPHNRRQHLDHLIDTYLLAQEARRMGLDQDTVFQDDLERERRVILAGRFYEKILVDSLPPLSDAELRAAFVRSKEQVVLRHLFYRDESAARAAYARLEAGRDFMDEAQDCYSLAVYDSLAGYLGPVRYFEVDDAVAEAAFALEMGAYSKPVRSRYGWHILRAEDRIIQPLLTEAEYQTRKAGLTSQLSQRRRRLEGDRFVRRFMEQLNVQVNPQAIQALALALKDLEHRAVPDPAAVQLAANEEGRVDLEALRAALTPGTPLLTYEWQGEHGTFTASAYYAWLAALPFNEARQRTAASVGRALRNEIFSLEARRLGLADDPFVQREVAQEARYWLARRLRRHLREQPAPEADTTLAYAAGEALFLTGTEDEIAEQVVPYLNEFLLLKVLREEAVLEGDLTLIEEIL